MRTRTTFVAAVLVAAGALLGWLAATGWQIAVLAQDQGAPPKPKGPDSAGKLTPAATPVKDKPQKPGDAGEAIRPNIINFHVDNRGYGELGCYGGGILRGADTKRIDAFAKQGMKLLNFAPETRCTPSRSALMTGRYSIRSGTHTVALAGDEGGLVAWEKTMGDVLSAHGYATCCVGKWHIGASEGRWPTDHGFDEWYGPPRSYDECLWADLPARPLLGAGSRRQHPEEVCGEREA